MGEPPDSSSRRAVRLLSGSASHVVVGGSSPSKWRATRLAIARPPSCARASSSRGWQRVAERQSLARARAQHTNRALLAHVQRRADWIERLWTLLRETRRLDLARESRLAIDAVDAARLHRLKHLHAEATTWRAAWTAFEAEGVALETSREHDDRWTREVDADSGTARIVSVRQLPFDALATTRAVWRALTSAAADSLCANFVVLERSHHACAVKYEMRDACSIRCHAVVQTLVAAGESDAKAQALGATLFVWQALSSVSRGDKTAMGTDTMWIAVSPCVGSALLSTVAIVAHSQADASTDADDAKLFLDAITVPGEACVSEIQAIAENALVDSELSLETHVVVEDVAV